MMDALKDPRTHRLMRELSRRFPETTLVTRRWRDNSDPGEIVIEVLNAPVDAVEQFASRWKWKLWGDEPWPASVHPISPESTRKYHAADLARARRARPARRRRTRPTRKRAASR